MRDSHHPLSADMHSCHYEVARLIVAAVERIEQICLASGGPPNVEAVMATIAELDESVTSIRRTAEPIARQIALWFEQLPDDSAPALATQALADRARRLLYDS